MLPEDFKFGFQTMFFSASSCGNFGSIGHRTLRNSIATLPTFFIEEGFVFEPDKFFRVRSDNGGILDGGTTTKTCILIFLNEFFCIVCIHRFGEFFVHGFGHSEASVEFRLGFAFRARVTNTVAGEFDYASV